MVLFFVSQWALLHCDAFWRFCHLYADPVYDDFLSARATLRTMPTDFRREKVFLTGASQVREDFEMDFLNEEMGEDGLVLYNLGISGAVHPADTFMQGDEFLEKDPALVVYMPYIKGFYSEYVFEKMKYSFDSKILPHLFGYLGVGEILELRNSFIDSFLGKVFFVFRYRKSLQDVIPSLIEHLLGIERRTEPVLFAHRESRPDSYFREEIEKYGSDWFRRGRYTPLQQEFFKLFARSVVERGIPLIVMDSPSHPLLKKLYDTRLDTEYDGFLREQAEAIGYTYLSRQDLPEFGAGDFVDFTHLNEAGRKKFNSFLVKQLRKEIRKGALPAGRGSEGRGAPEQFGVDRRGPV